MPSPGQGTALTTRRDPLPQSCSQRPCDNRCCSPAALGTTRVAHVGKGMPPEFGAPGTHHTTGQGSGGVATMAPNL